MTQVTANPSLSINDLIAMGATVVADEASTIKDNRGNNATQLGVELANGIRTASVVRQLGPNLLIFTSNQEANKFAVKGKNGVKSGEAFASINLTDYTHSRLLQVPMELNGAKVLDENGAVKMFPVLGFVNEKDAAQACINQAVLSGKGIKGVTDRAILEESLAAKTEPMWADKKGTPILYVPGHKQLAGKQDNVNARRINMAANVNTLAKYFGMTQEQIKAPFQVFDLLTIPNFMFTVVDGISYYIKFINYNPVKSVDAIAKAAKVDVNAEKVDLSILTEGAATDDNMDNNTKAVTTPAPAASVAAAATTTTKTVELD